MYSCSRFYDTKGEAKIANQEIERKKLLKRLEGNEKALNMLSVERLKKLEAYYNSIITQNNEKIIKLKKSI